MTEKGRTRTVNKHRQHIYNTSGPTNQTCEPINLRYYSRTFLIDNIADECFHCTMSFFVKIMMGFQIGSLFTGSTSFIT